MNDEIGLIKKLIFRWGSTLPALEKTDSKKDIQTINKINNTIVNSLLQLSQTKINEVINYFLELLEEVLKQKSKENELNISVKSILTLLSDCIKSSWDGIKGQYQTMQVDEQELIKISQKIEQSVPPSLDNNTIQKSIQLLLPLFFQTPFRKEAGICFYYLSATSYEHIFNEIIKIFNSFLQPTKGKTVSEEEFMCALELVSFLHLNSDKLVALMSKLETLSKNLKKINHQALLADILRTVIWNWINKFTMEFLSLTHEKQTGEQKISAGADLLFDIIDGWSKKSKKVNFFWPVQTMLLVLCPNILVQISTNSSSPTKESELKVKFLEKLAKSLKNNKPPDVATSCYIDICKASTYAPKSALRSHILPNIETELHNKLFNTKAPFKSATGSVDDKLMTELLVSSYRLNHRKIVNSLFKECLVFNEAASVFRQVAVSALLRIAREGRVLPWTPLIVETYSTLVQPIRSLFPSIQQQFEQYDAKKNLTDRKSKAFCEAFVKEIEILSLLIELFDADPNLPLHSLYKNPQDLEEIKQILIGLCACICRFDLPQLSEFATKALLVLHKTNHIKMWSPNTQVSGFWEVSSSIASNLSDILINTKNLNLKQTSQIISTLEEILRYRNDFLANTPNNSPQTTISDLITSTATRLEISLLINLVSIDTDVCTKTSNCLLLLTEEVDIMGDSLKTGITQNYHIYKKLGEVSKSSTGRAHQQKLFRNTLSRLDRTTQGSIKAWEIMYERWQAFTIAILQIQKRQQEKDIIENPNSGDKEKILASKVIPVPKNWEWGYLLELDFNDLLQEWTHLTGLLCASSGVILNQESRVELYLMKFPKEMCSKTKTIDAFITLMLDLTFCDNVNVRENSKQLLSNNLAPSAFPALFKILYEIIIDYFGENKLTVSTHNEDTTLFIEQTTAMMKVILDRPLERDDLTLISNFEDLLLSISRYISQILTERNKIDLQIKNRLCTLIDSVVAKKNYLQFSGNARETLVETLIEWTSQFRREKENSTSSCYNIEDNQIKKLVKDLDTQALQSIAALLRGLKLAEEDNEKFTKFFSFFTKILTNAKEDKETPKKVPQYTIRALSNLLSANTNAGLNFFVTMGYSNDIELRTSFLKVLGNILKQGTKLDSLSDDAGKYDKLIELLIDDDFDFVIALCETVQITEADELADVLTNVFEANDKTTDLIKIAIAVEIQKTEAVNTLFRRNSIATKLLTQYSMLIGNSYLKETIGPLLMQILTKNTGYELDPSKLPEGQNIQDNQKAIWDLAINVLERVEQSVDSMPLPFREICAFMQEAVSQKFPGHAHTAIGGFIFLRFVCPSLVTPDGYGLVQNMPKEPRRGLVLVAKTLQNLANKQKFTKEPFMDCMNVFVDENLERISVLFDRLAVIPQNMPPHPPVLFAEEQKEFDLERFHWYISNNLKKISQVLGSSPERQKVLERLTTTLAELGPAPEENPKKKREENFSLAKRTGGDELQQFMNEYSKKDISELKKRKIFYKGTSSKEAGTVFYFIISELKRDIDSGLLTYMVLKELQPFFSADQPFSLVVDISFMEAQNQPEQSWAQKLHKLIPALLTDNLRFLIVLNPSRLFKKLVGKRWLSRLIAKGVSKKLTMTVKLEKVQKLLAINELQLPQKTLALFKLQANWKDCEKISRDFGNQTKDCTLQLSNNTFQIVYDKSVKVLDQPAQFLDIYNISDLKNIVTQENSFSVRFADSSGEKVLNFKTSSSEQIVHALEAAKTRYNLSKPQVSVRTFRPSDVPGTLLNLAFLNIGSSNPETRTAGYNLLTAICNYFNYEVSIQLFETQGLCVPRANNNFVVKTSKQLAKSLPNLTLEFVSECLHGFKKAPFEGKHLCLSYLKPWLPNLKEYFKETLQESTQNENTKLERLTNIITDFVEITLNEKDIRPAILSKIWKPIGGIAESLDIVIDSLINRYLKEGGILPNNLEIMEPLCDIAITVAIPNSLFFTQKLVYLLLKLLSSTSQNPVEDLSKHPLWNNISVVTRFLLMLSFDNLIHVEQYLPQLLHIVVLLFSTGSYIERATIHRFLLNIIHSLYLLRVTPENRLPPVAFHLQELTQIKNLVHFGFGSYQKLTPFTTVLETSEGNKDSLPPKFQINNVENVALTLRNIVEALSNNQLTGTKWHKGWLDLTLSTAFTPNPAMQSRAFVALGVIITSPELATDDLIAKLLGSLKGFLDNPKVSQDLVVSIVICFSWIFEYIPPTSIYFSQLFWLAISLLQIKQIPMFSSAITLLENILKVADRHNCFENTSVENFFMSSRKDNLIKSVLDKLDSDCSISFENSFSFAISAHMLKGLKHPKTKSQTARTLALFVEICSKQAVDISILGYLAALLPLKGDNVSQIIKQTLGGGGSSGNQFVWTSEMIPDIKSAALLFTFFSVMLKNASGETEAETLYELLKEGVKFMPIAFPTTYPILVEKLGNVVEVGQNQEILKNVISILDQMFSHTMESCRNESKTSVLLNQIGFNGLTNLNMFPQSAQPSNQPQTPQLNVSNSNLNNSQNLNQRPIPTKTPVKQPGNNTVPTKNPIPTKFSKQPVKTQPVKIVNQNSTNQIQNPTPTQNVSNPNLIENNQLTGGVIPQISELIFCLLE